MSEPPSIDFTVTPYADEVEQSGSAQPDRGSGLAYLPAVLWLGAAVIAVAANFLAVDWFRTDGQGPDGQDATFRFSTNGWGQPSLSTTSPGDLGDRLNSGARWGWLFIACAVLLVVAAIWSVLPTVRFRLFGPADVAVAGVFGLFGGIAALILSFGPTRHQLSLTEDPANSKFSWGWCWQVELGAAAIGLLGWVWFRWQRAEPRPEAGYNEAPSDAEVTDLGTENWLEDATDRPHIARDPGPSPW